MDAAERACRIAMILMDVDGTLTDGTLCVQPDGTELKSYHVRDGLGILMAGAAGIKTGIITGKTSKALVRRADRLGIKDVHQGALDKRGAFKAILEKHELRPEQVAFIGDDLGDLPVLEQAGLAGAVADASAEVKARCHYVCSLPGGRGAVREFIEFILKAQGKWDGLCARITEIGKPAAPAPVQ
jgi:3-deoxy-D-manno-octulosonate 8-phosphate phosphatase (KDO 8-P phosphatase)